MSEIKSTVDIVLEKTKHLTLSEDEKRAQKKKEARQNLAGLLQKYQDEVLDIHQLKDNLNKLREFSDFIDTHALVSEILNRIELDKDNRSFMVILDDIRQSGYALFKQRAVTARKIRTANSIFKDKITGKKRFACWPVKGYPAGRVAGRVHNLEINAVY